MTSPEEDVRITAEQVQHRLVNWNRWESLVGVPEYAGLISVVVPARCDQYTLDRFVAAIEHQVLPDGTSLEVIVVDHGSIPHLTKPASDLDIKLERLTAGYGPGAARAHGATHAHGEILVFFDVDVLPEHDAIWQYAQLPIACDYAVALGFRSFIDPALVDDTDLAEAIRTRSMADYFAPRTASEGQEWIDKYLSKTEDNKHWRDDLWIVVVGAGIGVSRSFYDYAGGFRDFPFHGVEDTELGWRLFQAGGVVVPNRKAHGYHVGLRTISKKREDTNFRRHGTLANMIPHKRFRKYQGGRQWQVPAVMIQVLVRPDDCFESVVATCNSLLATDMTDLCVYVHADAHYPNRDVLESHFMGDSRIIFDEGSPIIPESVPVVIRTVPGAVFSKDAVRKLVRVLDSPTPIGYMGIAAGELALAVEVWRTAALSRVTWLLNYGLDERELLRRTFAEEWAPGERFGVSVASQEPIRLGEKA